MIEWTKSRMRQLLGATMFWAFIALAYQFYFFAKVFGQYREWYIAMGMLLGIYWHMWIPSVVVIVITYLLMTKVYNEDAQKSKKKKNQRSKVLKLYPKNWLIEKMVNMIFNSSKTIEIDKDEETVISGFRYVME